MKGIKKLAVLATLCITCAFSPLVATVSVSATHTTGYTKAEDVVYVKESGKVANWGVREEECTFLSTYAQSFYKGNYIYDVISQKNGGTSQDNAHTSDLFDALHDLMATKHKTKPSYQASRYLYLYTDCQRSDTTTISCFYTANDYTSEWNQGNIWNREHTWPQSKSLNGSKDGGEDGDDFILLRPASSKINNSRGNKGYGEGSSFYDPDKSFKNGESVRGDCARIILYVYTRWGNFDRMWGANGVMESLSILLKWMEEDPVDTWEMGRNDAVESITGTRNVFVDYPEYAWLLFGKEIPTDMPTPSGIAKSLGEGNEPSEPSKPSADDANKPTGGCEEGRHAYSEWITVQEATGSQDGLRMRTCYACGHTEDEVLPATHAVPKTTFLGLLLGCNSSLGIISGMSVVLACAFVTLRKKK